MLRVKPRVLPFTLAAPSAATATIPVATQSATWPTAALSGAAGASLALPLPLPLAHKTVGPNVAKGSFHGIRLGLGSLPVGAVTAVIFHISVRSAPVSAPALSCPFA